MFANRIIPANDAPDTIDSIGAIAPVPAHLIMLAGLAEHVRAVTTTMIAERPSDEAARNYALMAVRHADGLLALALARYGTWFVFNDAIRFMPLPGSPPDFRREEVAAKKARKERAAQAAGAREPKVYSLQGIQVIDPDGRLV